MKSLTGSRKVVAVSYNVVEGIETEAASSIAFKEKVVPDMLIQESVLCTGTAFDNYDELSETLSGKGILHDIVGICYQNRSLSKSSYQISSINSDELQKKGQLQEEISKKPSKRRRQYDPPSRNIAPYKKKPSTKSFAYDMYENSPPNNLRYVIKLDLIWMLSCFLGNDTYVAGLEFPCSQRPTSAAEYRIY